MICKKTDKEAENLYNYYALKHGDFVAAKNFVNQMPNNLIRATNLKRLHLFTGSLWAHVVKGSPNKVLEQLIKIKKCGFDGVALSFFNYSNEIKYFTNQVLRKIK